MRKYFYEERFSVILNCMVFDICTILESGLKRKLYTLDDKDKVIKLVKKKNEEYSGL